MLRLPAFQFHAPETAAEAARILAEDPANTRVVAGGTDLWPNMKRRHQGAKTIVSLRSIPEMSGICVDDEGGGVLLDGGERARAHHREHRQEQPLLDAIHLAGHPLVGGRRAQHQRQDGRQDHERGGVGLDELGKQ